MNTSDANLKIFEPKATESMRVSEGAHVEMSLDELLPLTANDRQLVVFSTKQFACAREHPGC